MNSRQTRDDTTPLLSMAERAIIESRRIIDSMRSSDLAYRVEMERMRKTVETSWGVIRSHPPLLLAVASFAFLVRAPAFAVWT